MIFPLEITYARNGEQTFSINNILFHSSYNPQKEAQRFVENLKFENTPDTIIVIEPGFNYILPFLREKFPKSKLGKIQIIENISDLSDSWDFSLNFHIQEIENFFLYELGEDKIFSTALISWTGAENCLKGQISQIIDLYKICLEKCKTFLITRQYFEKRWLLNSFKFLLNINNSVCLNNAIKKSVVICASGPSLKSVLPVLKQYRSKFFIIGLSSSSKALIKNDIKPDVILSTDGGFWAGEHIKNLKKDIILGLTPESFSQSFLLKRNSVFTLCYPDGFSKKLMDFCKIPYLQAQRNGTITGTALDLALSLTKEKIFLCGTDLKGQTGYQHIQPNELEINNFTKDYLLKNAETRQTGSEFNSSSLNIYRQWFSSKTHISNVFRVIDSNNDRLGQIKDIGTSDFIEISKNLSEGKAVEFSKFPVNENKKLLKEKLNDFLDKNMNTYEWKKQIFPADIISIFRCTDTLKKQNLESQLNEKNNSLIAKIRKIING